MVPVTQKRERNKEKLVVKGAENHILKAYLEGVTEGECVPTITP
jgi:hypothetical protein